MGPLEPAQNEERPSQEPPGVGMEVVVGPGKAEHEAAVGAYCTQVAPNGGSPVPELDIYEIPPIYKISHQDYHRSFQGKGFRRHRSAELSLSVQSRQARDGA